MKKISAVLILHDIRSAHNVGAIFRTADAVGITKIYLTGITPLPIDRFGKARKDITKAALGAENTIPWESKKMIQPLITTLQKEGFFVAAIEQSDRSIDYKKYKPSTNVAFVLGNEVSGIAERILSRCDSVLEIPMRGKKESLNVSVAAGIVLYQTLRI
ncbi:MAG: TrmH family RNA methyltransferase [Candidatus Pacebacteria bacterium]|jgi:tRNA G18 (ribose-2'-O)-methylase SpoU|nr:TrmH family RNA methyltransferase [Candidatus Paceibacterota bacterium]